ncbi:MAG: protease complex subunit PrcB family protein [Bacteroidota bacterium]|nr:protease complex subunit PrcB family protein [Bacteroidota bacterium]
MKKLLQTIIFASLVFSLTACQEAVELDDGPDDVLAFEAIALGHHGATRDTVEVILRSQAELEEALKTVTPLDEVPEVDFEQYMVGLIAVPTESGGYIVEVKSVEQTGSEITVHYVLNVPAEDCITVQALSLPHQIVQIRRSEGNVTFVQQRDRYLCGMKQRR